MSAQAQRVDEISEWMRSDEFVAFALEHYPPSDYVKRLLEFGKDQEAERRYNTEILAGMMGLTVVEYQRRYPTERRQTMDKRRVVYFISASPNLRVGCLVKIGMASNARRRLAAIQVHHPKPLHLLATITGGRPLERDIHERFAESRTRGEWFRITPELKAYIKERAE